VAPHEAQLLPLPLMARVSPLFPLLMAANKEIVRAVSALPHWAQETGASAWLMGRSF